MKVRFSTILTRGFLFSRARRFDRKFRNKKDSIKESLWDQGNCRVLSAPNFYCCYFNGISHGLFRWSLYANLGRVESGVQCVTNGAENSSS